MSRHTLHEEKECFYFITFACFRWLRLFELTLLYDKIYNWFGILKQKDCHVSGYVIMPNHMHMLVYAGADMPVLNRLIANGKRFLAYEIVKRLTNMNHQHVLHQLTIGVQRNERKIGKRHQVFQLSFDAKVCFSEKMIVQKLDYIHRNPVSGVWRLVDDFTGYAHSSAAYYELEQPIHFPVLDYRMA